MDVFANGPAFRTLASLLQAHAERHPGKSAVVDVDSGRSIAFGELAGVVDGVALQLQRRGVSAGARVVLCTASGIETVVMWLALWRLAAVVCPLDAAQFGTATAHAVLVALKPMLVLRSVHSDTPDLPEGVDVPEARFNDWPTVPRDARDGTIALASLRGSLREAPCAQSADVAAMCCTSGSTGRTKVVVHDHGSYWLNGLDSIELLDLHGDDRTLEYRSFSWYSSQILSLTPFLQLGLTLHLARQFSRSRFGDWIERHRITVAAGVPTVLNVLLSGPMQSFPAQARSLRLMTSSSAPLIRATWQRFERASGVPLVNLYGSSEAGWICGNRLADRRIGSVGRPARRAVFDILDADNRPCPPGMPGQVVVAGPKLALGLFQADGSIEPLRGGLHRTHDLALRADDGYIELLGRLDDLVIRGGIKVSPQEIEEALLTHADVVEAGAIGVPDSIYGQEAICFVVLREGATSDAASLHTHASASLPREKRPKAVHVVDALPRNARGKLERDKLRQR